MDDIQSLELEFLSKPDYGMAKIKLQKDQTVCVEASSMVSMDTNVVMKSKMKGGIVAALKRAATGESMIVNEFTATDGLGEICVAPGAPGDLDRYTLKPGQSLYLQSGAYLASTMGVNVDLKWQGFKGFFGGSGLFLLKLSGEGEVLFNSYGAIIELPIENEYIIDTGYVLAFEDSLQYNVRILGGIKTTLLGGEGLVCEFNGTGKLWLQTRKVAPFCSWLWPFRPKKQKNKNNS